MKKEESLLKVQILSLILPKEKQSKAIENIVISGVTLHGGLKIK